MSGPERVLGRCIPEVKGGLGHSLCIPVPLSPQRKDFREQTVLTRLLVTSLSQGPPTAGCSITCVSPES